MLADNTGEMGAMLLFDAVRVLALDDAGSGGCCDASRDNGTTALFGLALVTLVMRRRAPRA